ncbi:MAG TPA: hypothetical protein HA272_10775 [Methanoregula sp.]|nr:hypothetical protein [Methanoregula sp.]
MQCPACGYDGIAEEVCFCPHCRYQFRALVPEAASDNSMLFEPEPVAGPADAGDLFVEIQARQIQIQLLQPALLVMLATAGALYLAGGGRIADLAVTVSTFEIRYGIFLCLLAGAIIGWIFYRIMLRRIE